MPRASQMGDIRVNETVDFDHVRPQSRGARFLRCALQVNPFPYLARHGTATSHGGEDEYNEALVEACRSVGIDAIAITDHYRVRSAESLMAAATAAGIFVFPGFEAVTKDGVHLLCLFDPGTSVEKLERLIGACGIHDDEPGSPVGTLDVVELLREARKWGGVTVAAHVAAKGGLLRNLSGQSCINAWRSGDLLACALPGPIVDAPSNLRPIIENKNPDYRRDTPVAVVNASDVSDPAGIGVAEASCWIKMSEVTVEGLRQAFLDPLSRIRLASDPVPDDHAELIAMTWQGGFLDGTVVHFNENLNVLVGGRGAGKSTVIESLRHVLDLEPIGEEAGLAHRGIVSQVLKNGTKISLRVRSTRPATHDYLIERTIPNPPVVRDQSGVVVDLAPGDILPRVEVFGQHEIAELARDGVKRTRLLTRFHQPDEELAERKTALRRSLAKNRRDILAASEDLQQVEEDLAALPGLEETLKRFQEAGLEDRLSERSLLVREERVLTTTSERLATLREYLDTLREAVPVDRLFLAAQALDDLPGGAILAGAGPVFDRLNEDLQQVVRLFEQALEKADTGIDAVAQEWRVRQQRVQAEYEGILRELQKASVDGEEFIRLRREIERLRPLRDRRDGLRRVANQQAMERAELLAEWEDLKAGEYRRLDDAARRVNGLLRNVVQVEVSFGADRGPFATLLRREVGGQLAAAIERLGTIEGLSLTEFANACRSGEETLRKTHGLTPAQARNIAGAPPELPLLVEELELPSTTTIKLNTNPSGEAPNWRALDDLSKGQKATAILLLLLLESDAPLIVDQPEDDLDNRFITENVVPRMREEKRRRQFVFSTHNANIPVLGDAELILGLSAAGEAADGRAWISPEHAGSIDAETVRDLVEDILEGGKAAFEMRRLKYGF